MLKMHGDATCSEGGEKFGVWIGAHVRPSGARQHGPARSSCAAASSVRSAPLKADTLKKSEDSTSDALFTPELMASMQPTISLARALSARDLLTEF